MSNVRCLLSYHKSKVNALPIFAVGVRDGVYQNPNPFATVPILEAEFQGLITEYNNKRGAYEQGGLAQKGPYLNARESLLAALDQLAAYVDSVAQGNEAVILLAGFVPSKGNRSGAPAPVQPTGVLVKRGEASGVLLAECANQDAAINYGCIVTKNEPLPDTVVLNDNGQLVVNATAQLPAGGGTATGMGSAIGIFDLNPSRKKRFANLTPGAMYYFVFFAANATGVSDLSDPVGIMCA